MKVIIEKKYISLYPESEGDQDFIDAVLGSLTDEGIDAVCYTQSVFDDMKKMEEDSIN